jgi:hypothetical protein
MVKHFILSKNYLQQFYEKTLDYLNRWTAHLEEIGEFAADWLIFESPPSWQVIRAAYKKYCSE